MKKWTKETAWWPEAHWKMGPTTVPLQNNWHIVLVLYHDINNNVNNKNQKVDCLMATYYPIFHHIIWYIFVFLLHSIVFFCFIISPTTTLLALNKYNIVAPGKQLTDGDRVNRTRDHLQLYRDRKYKDRRNTNTNKMILIIQIRSEKDPWSSSTVQREKIMYRMRKYKEIRTKKYRNMRHCKHTNKQSGEIQRWAKYTQTNTDRRGTTNTKDLIIFDHPFNYPAERERKQINNENKLCLPCTVRWEKMHCIWRPQLWSEDISTW